MVAGDFPNLKTGSYFITSPPTISYNCIAWAAGSTTKWWWPHPDSYWPDGVPQEETVEAFVLAYATQGYERCNNALLEDGYEKIAIYANESGPQHAARQLDDGRWTSKLGEDEDITHVTLEALSSDLYGRPVCFLRRERGTP